MRGLFARLMCLAVFVFPGCVPDAGSPGVVAPSASSFTLVLGSENRDLADTVFQPYARQQGVDLKLAFSGSVDIELMLESGAVEADAVMPSSSLWLQLGDTRHLVKDAKSVMRSPVVFGVNKPVARELGWAGNPDVTVEQIYGAMESGRLRVAMTSASQSNSGAMAYLGFLSAFAETGDVLTHEHLANADVQKRARQLFATVNRSSASSGWLKDLYLKDPDSFDAMVNYEAVVIGTNRELAAAGRDPLCAVYPADGVRTADFPLGYVDHGDPAKAAFFQGLQAYLLSEATQKQLETLGRRPALALSAAPDPSVFNPDWCVDATRTLSSPPLPTAEVIGEALELYQTSLRKPSLTQFVLDYSGSMNGDREQQLEGAVDTVLEPVKARRLRLQASGQDVNNVFVFSNEVEKLGTVEGNDPAALRGLSMRVRGTNVGGGTMLYTAVVAALEDLRLYQIAHPDRDDPKHISRYFPAVVVLTDGQANDEATVLDRYLADHPEMRDIPVFAIRFGEADQAQLEGIARNGRVFDGADLVKAMRDVRGYN